jgi:hypothetical protein
MNGKRLAAAGAVVLGLGALTASPGAHAQAAQGNAGAPKGEDPSKFFLFHLDGVSTDVARGDLYYCIRQARSIVSERDRMGGGGGILGAIINGRMAEIDRFRMRTAAMRKCMALHGYARYQVPSAEWNAIVGNGDLVVDNKGHTDLGVLDRLAAWASGPAPTGERLVP